MFQYLEVLDGIIETMKIVIAGYGLEGISSLRYFQQVFPDAEFIIADQKAVENAQVSYCQKSIKNNNNNNNIILLPLEV